MKDLSDLPTEVLLIIAKDLPPRSQYALSLTCRDIFSKVKHLLPGHKLLHSQHRILSTRFSMFTGQVNRAWLYLDRFMNNDQLAQYVEFMDLTKRLEIFEYPHTGLNIRHVSPNTPEDFPSHEYAFRQLLQIINPDDTISFWREGSWKDFVTETHGNSDFDDFPDERIDTEEEWKAGSEEAEDEGNPTYGPVILRVARKQLINELWKP